MPQSGQRLHFGLKMGWGAEALRVQQLDRDRRVSQEAPVGHAAAIHAQHVAFSKPIGGVVDLLIAACQTH